eukprot:gene14059-biopygen12612
MCSMHVPAVIAPPCPAPKRAMQRDRLHRQAVGEGSKSLLAGRMYAAHQVPPPPGSQDFTLEAVGRSQG